MMKITTSHIIQLTRLAALALPLWGLTACSDHLFDDLVGNGEGDDANGMQFAVNTTEMGELLISVGDTRSTTSSSSSSSSSSPQQEEADHYAAHTLNGNNPYGLQVYRMPLPYVGIHQGMAKASPSSNTSPSIEASTSRETSTSSETSPNDTRAPLSEVVTTTTLFHDSLTIWGYAYDKTQCDTLFNGSLLKQIRGWRSSVQWPYGKGDHMQFYAISPAYESLNLNVTNPSFDADAGTFTPPTFTYTLPETAGEMRDLLYGTGYVESVEAGPAGSITANPKAENLGKDNKFIDLHFQHLLTAIRFAQGSIPSDITVKSITLKSIYTQGDYDPAATDAATGTTGSWTIDDKSTKLSYTLTTNFSGTGTTNTYIDNNQVFLVIPHTLTEDATLEIEIEAPQHYKVDENGMYTPLYGDREAADENTPRTTHILTCSLTDDVWKKGYTVTYMLTIGQVADGYYLIAEQPEALSHDETNGHFTLHSYRSYFDYSNSNSGTEDFSHAVPWKVVGYSNSEPTSSTDFSDAKPQWLNDGLLTSSTAQTGGYATNIPFTLSAQSATKSGNHQTILESNTTQASNWDLSKVSPNNKSYSSPSQQPANCYIVNRQGSYQFPLIYGNKTSDGVSKGFVDHTGTTISHSLIKDQIEAKNPAADAYETIEENVSRKRTSYTWTSTVGSSQTLRAVVVWQDESGLVTSPSIASDHIGFTISKSTPGNALIALQGRTETVYEKSTDGGNTWVTDTSQYGDWETFWTWHIWMTDEVYPNEGSQNGIHYDAQFLNYNSTNRDHIVSLYKSDGTTEKAKILPVNLGWVPDKMDFSYYKPRTVWVKLQQVVPNVADKDCPTTVVKIQQHARQPLVTGTSTVYQWGRPTALPALRHMDMTARPVYGASGSTDISGSFTVQNITAPGEAISNPLALCRTSSDGGTWFDTSGTVPPYWGNNDATTKTVYDPCPPGFYIPNYGIFTGFKRTGATADDGSSLNMWEDAGQHGKGAYFYTTPNETNRYGQTVYMPATGQYSADHPAGTEMNTTISHEDTNAGQVWGSGSGKALWFYPQWERTESEGKAIQLPRTVPFSTAIPVRPAGSLLAY